MKKTLLFTAILSTSLFTTEAAFAACEVTPDQDQNGDGYDDSLVATTARISSDSEVTCDSSTTVGDDTRVSRGSLIEHSSVGAQSRIINGTLSYSSSVGSNARVVDSLLWQSTILDDARVLRNSSLNNNSTIGRGSTIVDSTLFDTKVAEDSRITSSILDYVNVGSDVRIINTNIQGNLTIEDDVLIKGATIFGGDRGGAIQKGARIFNGAAVNMGFGQTISSDAVIGENAKILHGGGFFSGRLLEEAEVWGSADVVGDVVIGKRSKFRGQHVTGPVRIGNDSSVGFGGGGRIEQNVRVGSQTVILDINLNEDVTVASNVYIAGSPYLIGARTSIRTNVVIGYGVTIGEDVTIRNGAQIGENVVIGDGAIIVSGAIVPDGTVVAANSVYQ